MSFIFVDRILQLEPGKSIHGVKHVRFDEPYSYLASNGKLSFVSSLIGEALGQLAAWNVMKVNNFKARPVAGVVTNTSLLRPVYAGETLTLAANIEHLDEEVVQYSSIARVNEEIVFTINGALGPLLPMDDFISQEEVQGQFNQLMDGSFYLKQQSRIPSHCLHFTENINVNETSISAEKEVNHDDPYLQDHFPSKPVLPLTILLTWQINLAAFFLTQLSFSGSFKIIELRKIKMNAFIKPGDRVFCQLRIKEQTKDYLILTSRTEVASKRVCITELVMARRD